MAVGPDGTIAGGPDGPSDGARAEDLAFLRGLEAAIDRALARHPRGETFVFGIYQELEPQVRERLVDRYRRAGWPHAHLREGLTGAYNLVLIPE